LLAVYLETSVVANGNVDGNDGVHVLAGMAVFDFYLTKTCTRTVQRKKKGRRGRKSLHEGST